MCKIRSSDHDERDDSREEEEETHDEGDDGMKPGNLGCLNFFMFRNDGG